MRIHSRWSLANAIGFFIVGGLWANADGAWYEWALMSLCTIAGIIYWSNAFQEPEEESDEQHG